MLTRRGQRFHPSCPRSRRQEHDVVPGRRSLALASPQRRRARRGSAPEKFQALFHGGQRLKLRLSLMTPSFAWTTGRS
jgi:hypothetical protein